MTVKFHGPRRHRVPKARYHRIQTTMSVGIASCIPRLEDKRDKLLDRADKALYRAKKNGKNQVVFYCG